MGFFSAPKRKRTKAQVLARKLKNLAKKQKLHAMQVKINQINAQLSKLS